MKTTGDAQGNQVRTQAAWKMLGKHWRDTKGGAPFQCSPESDLDFHVEPNELHMMVCLGTPWHLREQRERKRSNTKQVISRSENI